MLFQNQPLDLFSDGSHLNLAIAAFKEGYVAQVFNLRSAFHFITQVNNLRYAFYFVAQVSSLRYIEQAFTEWRQPLTYDYNFCVYVCLELGDRLQVFDGRLKRTKDFFVARFAIQVDDHVGYRGNQTT